jgi:predicted nuclease with TOPRIM domain
MEEQLNNLELKMYELERRIKALEDKEYQHNQNIFNLVQTAQMHTNILDSVAVILHLKDK